MTFSVNQVKGLFGPIISIVDPKGHQVAEIEIKDKTIREIMTISIQQATKQAKSLRSPDVVFMTTVHEGLVLLRKQYIALLTNRIFLQGSSATVSPVTFNHKYHKNRPGEYSIAFKGHEWITGKLID